MRKVLLISPHFDDAVLSAGQFMAGRPDCEVVTVFAGYPTGSEGVRTAYDKKCGFKNAQDAVSVRRFEDSQATAMLQATSVHLRFSDGQYNENVDPEEIKAEILDLIEKEDYEFVLAPMGLEHPDHELVSDCVTDLVDDGAITLPVYLWEDLPTRVVYPEIAFSRIIDLDLQHLVNIGDGPISDKIRALWCYKSQMNTGILDPYVMYVPERFWKYK